MKVIRQLSLSALMAATIFCTSVTFVNATETKIGEFPALPYAYDALEPHIDAETMQIHHQRHHQAYYNNLLKALEGKSYAEASLTELFNQMDTLPDAVRNNAGGHFNHSLFWQVLSPNGGGEPKEALKTQIEADFGSFSAFQEAFAKASMGRFGSGWAWLIVDPTGQLKIVSTANQDNPLMSTAETKGTPILGLDVWEHAYYLKYQNKRADYIEAYWHVVNWDEVAKRFEAAK